MIGVGGQAGVQGNGGGWALVNGAVSDAGVEGCGEVFGEEVFGEEVFGEEVWVYGEVAGSGAEVCGAGCVRLSSLQG